MIFSMGKMEKKSAYIISLILVFILAVPLVSASSHIDCADNVVFAYFDPISQVIDYGRWEDVLNLINGFNDADFCTLDSITFLLSNDYTNLKYIMTKGQKYVTFTLDINGANINLNQLQSGSLVDVKDDAGNAALQFGNQILTSPSSATSIVLEPNQNQVVLTQDNLVSSVYWTSSSAVYSLLNPVDIATHFASSAVNSPVPSGLNSFNALAEVYDWGKGIAYFVVSGDGRRYSFYGPRKGSFNGQTTPAWRTFCEINNVCGQCSDNSCPVSSLKDSQGNSIFSKIFAATPFSTREDILSGLNVKYAVIGEAFSAAPSRRLTRQACGSNNCNLCLDKEQCNRVQCSWAGSACQATCDNNDQCRYLSVHLNYCTTNHCCPLGQVWDPNARGPGIGACRLPRQEIGGPCVQLAPYSTGEPYRSTQEPFDQPPYEQACCTNIGNAGGYVNPYLYTQVEPY